MSTSGSLYWDNDLRLYVATYESPTTGVLEGYGKTEKDALDALERKILHHTKESAKK